MARPSLPLSKCQIVGNLMPRINYYIVSKMSLTLISVDIRKYVSTIKSDIHFIGRLFFMFTS